MNLRKTVLSLKIFLQLYFIRTEPVLCISKLDILQVQVTRVAICPKLYLTKKNLCKTAQYSINIFICVCDYCQFVTFHPQLPNIKKKIITLKSVSCISSD